MHVHKIAKLFYYYYYLLYYLCLLLIDVTTPYASEEGPVSAHLLSGQEVLPVLLCREEHQGVFGVRHCPVFHHKGMRVLRGDADAIDVIIPPPGDVDDAAGGKGGSSQVAGHSQGPLSARAHLKLSVIIGIQ